MNIPQYFPALALVIVSKFVYEEVMRSQGRAIPEALRQLCKRGGKIELSPSAYSQDNIAVVYLQGETLPRIIKMEPKNSK